MDDLISGLDVDSPFFPSEPPEDEERPETTGDGYILIAIGMDGRAVIIDIIDNLHEDMLESLADIFRDGVDFAEEPGLYKVCVHQTCSRDYEGDVDCWIDIDDPELVMPLMIPAEDK